MGATKKVDKKLEENDYDPHEHRNVKIPTTNTETFIHFLKASIGTGVLAMPSAFSNAGYINGLILTAIIGSIALYCLHLVINSMYELCKRKRIPYLTYPEAMTVAFQEGPPVLRCFAKIATPFVDGFLAFYHFGICCVYVVFIAESIKQIVDEYLIVLDLRIHMCFVLIPLFLIFSIRQLKHLVPFSSFANVLMFVGFGVVLYYIFVQLPPISQREAFTKVTRLPLFFGTVLFSLEAVGVVIAIEQNMKTPKAYTGKFGILNRGMFIVLGLYMGLGFFGYWKYGEEAKGSVTLNIPQDEILAQVIKIFFAVTTLISYALQGYVTADIIWNHYLIKKTTEKSNLVLYELLVRAGIVLLTFLCAIAIPDLSLFLSLVGAFCLSILGLIFPALLELCCRYSTSYGKFKFHLFKDIFLVVFGIFGGVIGTYVSISEIVEAYN
ncbi:proton-coupled amino acid transporter-like protein CG1139 [Episyrphus balteatus]|uniref:proton-coupled amino acid transporter-like protein CG1139 n=1 Tax=Episyrphus balteatus TaxID=286459 RepID=UPI002484F842|nr:proton-coupled amino acid transporter-like protein CG1139 [Episyrphus balteatus]XP_055841089.1 proton-coupled amino acid transporter-like protein CG1139 [Episyrphus balteatus]